MLNRSRFLKLIPILLLALSQSGIQTELNKVIEAQHLQFEFPGAPALQDLPIDDITSTLKDALVNGLASAIVGSLIFSRSRLYARWRLVSQSQGSEPSQNSARGLVRKICKRVQPLRERIVIAYRSGRDSYTIGRVIDFKRKS